MPEPTRVPQFVPFDSWGQLIHQIENYGHSYYQAPLDPRPVYVRCAVVKKGIRITPSAPDVDAFTADRTHFSRFRRRMMVLPAEVTE